MYTLRKCCAAAVVWLALACGGVALADDEHLDSLSAGGNTYANVTVMTKTSKHISFKHSKGFASVKVSDLPLDVQIQLGYTPPPPPKKPLDYTKDFTMEFKRRFQLDPRAQEMAEQIQKEVERRIEERDPVIIYGVPAGLGVAYLIFCLTAMLICRKTGNKPGLLVWIPVFQFISLLKAAGMSGWCFILLFVPIINILVGIIWCFKICITRGKSPALGVFLLLPVTQIFVWFYLAFSDGGKEDAAKTKGNSRKLRLSYQN